MQFSYIRNSRRDDVEIPEFFFVRDDGVAVNADAILPSKDNKMDIGNGCTLFFDGFQGELNIPSGYCREGLVSNVRRCLREARTAAVKKSRGKKIKCRLSIDPTIEVLPAVLAAADEEARIFGCDPDFDAYSGGSNPPGPDAETHLLRYSGGHIHIGYGREENRQASQSMEEERSNQVTTQTL